MANNRRVVGPIIMGLAILGTPFALGTIKGMEKKVWWVDREAMIVDVMEGTVEYSYRAGGCDWVHRQRCNVREGSYKRGDVVWVKVAPRNPALSILDPPVFQKFWQGLFWFRFGGFFFFFFLLQRQKIRC